MSEAYSDDRENDAGVVYPMLLLKSASAHQWVAYLTIMCTVPPEP